MPAYTPHPKGTVEAVNGAVEKMLFAGLPATSPLRSWLADPAPVEDADEARLWMFTLW